MAEKTIKERIIRWCELERIDAIVKLCEARMCFEYFSKEELSENWGPYEKTPIEIMEELERTINAYKRSINLIKKRYNRF